MVNKVKEEERLGRPLNYSQLKQELFSENEAARYKVGSPFVVDRIDRARPLDRVLYNGQWFCSGYIVSRQTCDNQTVFSQLIRIYPSQNDLYQVALIDLRRKAGYLPSAQFHARHFEPEMPRELLVPLSKIQFVSYTPTDKQYFNPRTMLNDQLEIERLRHLKDQVDNERQFKKSVALSKEMLDALKN